MKTRANRWKDKQQDLHIMDYLSIKQRSITACYNVNEPLKYYT